VASRSWLDPRQIPSRIRDPALRPWILPAVLGGYIFYVTWTWKFPNWEGVRFIIVWAGAVILGGLIARKWRGRIDPLDIAIAIVLAATVMSDIATFWTQGLRDFLLYLKAGDRWLEGDAVYLTSVLSVKPDDLTNYPFLYPPLTLPLFGGLASLPVPVASALWVGGSILAAYVALRRLGLGARWAILFLAWPPIFQGIYVGNVAIPVFLLFALAPWQGAGLVLSPVFKAYSAIAAAWLLLERRTRDILVGLVALIVVLVVTYPLVKPTLWFEWLTGLRLYEASQLALPDYLYGFGLTRWVPLTAILGLAALGLVAAALTRDPRERLARAGVATVAGSPSLFAHGFTFALPAMLALDSRWLWLVLGITSCSPGLAWWLLPLVVAISWLRPGLRNHGWRPDAHPLGTARVAWPTAPVRSRGGVTPKPAEAPTPADAAA
jgi:hypothetical protein